MLQKLQILRRFSKVVIDEQQIQETKDLIKKLQDQETGRYAQTLDMYRIDIGLIIDKSPGYLNISQRQLVWKRFRDQIYKKYDQYFPVQKVKLKYQKNLMEFKDSDPNINSISANPDNLETHQTVDKKDGLFYLNRFKYILPGITNPKSPQYAPNHRVYLLLKNKETQKWEFPNKIMYDQKSFYFEKKKLQSLYFQENMNLNFYPERPVLFLTRDFTEKEKEDPKNKYLNGVKTFYFLSNHVSGQMSYNGDFFDDFAWVPKIKMNKYLDREQYNDFIHALFLK